MGIQDSLWFAGKRPLVVAHRGASQLAPENTMAAFRKAIAVGADAVELDVKLTGDGRVVVLHDQTLDRTTSGTGSVSERSLAELKSLEAGAHFSQAFAGEPIPSLEEVFAAIGTETLVVVDVGNYASPFDALPDRVAELIRAFSLERRVLVSSFNPVALRRMRRGAGEVPLGLLQMPLQRRWQLMTFPWLATHELCHVHESMVDGKRAAEVASKGRRLVAWTVNDGERMAALLACGVFALITDVPDVAREIVDGYAGHHRP